MKSENFGKVCWFCIILSFIFRFNHFERNFIKFLIFSKKCAAEIKKKYSGSGGSQTHIFAHCCCTTGSWVISSCGHSNNSVIQTNHFLKHFQYWKLVSNHHNERRRTFGERRESQTQSLSLRYRATIWKLIFSEFAWFNSDGIRTRNLPHPHSPTYHPGEKSKRARIHSSMYIDMLVFKCSRSSHHSRTRRAESVVAG